MKPGRLICFWATLFAASSVFAATNSGPPDENLMLSPPHPELSPTVWEQYGAWAVLATVALLALASFVVWWWLRPKPPIVLPIAVQARQELAVLGQRSEDGQTLSLVSRVVRRYVVAAFELPSDELVTSEFSRVLAGHEKIGPELAAAVGEFLRRCDELKFAPSFTSESSVGVQASACPDLPSLPPATLKRELQPAAARALELVELGEVRRAKLSEVVTAVAGSQPPQGA